MAGKKFDYIGVDSSTLNLNNIINKIVQTNGEIQNLEKGLQACFIASGAGDDAATAWQAKIADLMKQAGSYTVAAENLRAKVDEVAGRDGLMHVTDKNQGSRFLSAF
jgi:hypothetical protein